MGQTFVGIRAADKAVGLVAKGERSNSWSVSWPDEEESSPIGVRDVCILGSPKFYKLVDPSVNKKHFDADPKYFIDALLAQEYPFLPPIDPTKLADSQESQNRPTPSSLIIKKKLVEWEVTTPDELKHIWSDIEQKYTKDSKTRFTVAKPLDFAFKVELPWSAQMEKSDKRPVATSTKKQETTPNNTASSLEELTIASQGKSLGAEYEARAKDFWTYLSHIQDYKIGLKELKKLGKEGSKATQTLVQAIMILADSKKSVPGENLWEQILILPTVDQRQYEIVLEHLVLNRVEIPDVKSTLRFIEESTVKAEKLLKKSTLLLADLAARILLASPQLLDSTSEGTILAIAERCTWQSGLKQDLLCHIIRKSRQFPNEKDIFLGIDLDSFLELPNTNLFKLLVDRDQFAALSAPYMESFIRKSSDSIELLGLLKFAYQAIGATSPSMLQLLTEKAFKGQTVFENAWVEISGQRQINELLEQNKRLQEQLNVLVKDKGDLEKAKVEALRYAEQLNSQLGKATNSANLNLEASNNAAKLDAARAVANMLASLNESAIEAKQEVLALVRPTLSRLGIQQIGQIGHEEVFSPELHSDADGVLKSGDTGVVWSPGYFTLVGSDQVILRKAQLSRK